VPDIADTVITHIMLRTLVLLAAVTATSATALSRPRVTPLVRSTPPAAEAALQLRGGGMVPADTFVKAWAAVFGLYAVQMLALPGKMVTDHFETASTPMLEFWIRGQSVSLGGLCYALTLLPTEIAVKIALASNVLIGFLYPYNAKFGYLTGSGFPAVKYPMHYVPEILMAGLTLAGALAL